MIHVPGDSLGEKKSENMTDTLANGISWEWLIDLSTIKTLHSWKVEFLMNYFAAKNQRFQFEFEASDLQQM